MALDLPRTAERIHPMDCSCCSQDPDDLDISMVALWFIVGLGWGGIAAFILDLIISGPGLDIIAGGAVG